MNPQFDTPQDIDREYSRRIDQESDPIRKADLRIEAATLKSDMVAAQKNAQLVSKLKELALHRFPEAAAFPQLVTGSTEDEIMQSAEAAHNRVVEIRRGASGVDPYEDARQQAQQFYGRGSAVGGTASMGTPAASATTDMATLRAESAFAEKFNNAPRDAYGQRMGISPQETAQYTNSRFIDHVKNAVSYWAMMTNSSYAGRRR